MADLSMAKLPWYGQLGVFVFASLAAAGAFYYFYEMPQQTVTAATATELSGVRARIATGVATARQLPEFRNQVGELESRLESLRPILPEEKDVGDLLRRIQTLATQSNLVIVGFRPQAINTREMHAEWPISLQLEGNYHNLGLFLDRVSKFPRIINIGDLVLTGHPASDGGATMDISATATTFVLVERPVTAPATKKGGKKTPAKTVKKS